MLSTLRRRVVRPPAVLPPAFAVGGGTWFVPRSDDQPHHRADGGAPAGPMDQAMSASGTVEAAATDDPSFTVAEAALDALRTE